MLIRSFPAGILDTNCYIIATDRGKPAVIVDPGQGAAEVIYKLVEEFDLKPEAILLTHGHADHTFDLFKVAEHYNIPTYIHPLDRPQLTDPASALAPDLAVLFEGIEFQEPQNIIELADEQELTIAGIRFEILHAPGHSAGSVVSYFTAEPSQDSDGTQRICLVGDVLFSGGVGRTDQPGCSAEQLLESIEKTILTREDEVIVLSGHGESTTIGKERATNKYLKNS